MTSTGWDRWSPLSGVLSVACFIVAILVYGNGPKNDDEKIVAYFAKHSHQVQYFVGFFFLFASLLLLLVFLASLRGRLALAEGEPGRLTALAFAGGVASTVLLMASNVFLAAPAVTVNDTSKFKLDPNTYRLISDTGYGLFISGVMAAIALVATTSVLALRTRVFPRWFAWLGFPAALTFVVAFAFIPVFILFGWVLVASALMLFWAPRAERAARPVPALG